MNLQSVEDFCTLVRGSSPRPSGDPRYYGGNIPRLMVRDITRDGMYVTPKIDFLTEDGATRSRPMKKGDLVIAVSGDPGEPSILNIDACIHDGFVGLREIDNKKVFTPYLYRYFKFNKEQSKSQAVGAIYKNLNTDQIKAFQIPLPPLPQQQKIANILDAADALRQKDKALLAKYDELTQALFLDMFGDPVSNPNRWKCIKGADIFKFSSGKFNPTKNLDESYTFPTYGGNGITGYSSEYLIDFDTIVIGRVGAYCGSVHKTKGKIWVTDNAIYIKDFKKDINLIFCYHTFKKYRLNRFADFSGQPKITQKPLENLQFIYPPLTLQNQFAERVQVIEQQKAIAQKSLEKSEALFNSLLQKAFKGGLVRA
jgi:type I restriction enzyme S subunit